MGGTRLSCAGFLGPRGLSDVDCGNALRREEMVMLVRMRFCERESVFFVLVSGWKGGRGGRGKRKVNEGKEEKRCVCVCMCSSQGRVVGQRNDLFRRSGDHARTLLLHRPMPYRHTIH